ncbi:hypothetical protein IEQ34_008214 [Dendrobium chrysotoxum]|uniref:Uncharacterized protein n=1 Tax=Dendrobium chrysotoxum TaxID=161865 RepID=A0AAV7H3Y0_DENCH|nr:hypothetical protein IEQ34_008214 [Dendrobium chrysotoxum]
MVSVLQPVIRHQMAPHHGFNCQIALQINNYDQDPLNRRSQYKCSIGVANGIASLKKLSIVENDELVSFPNEAEQWFLKVSSSLCELNFEWLKSLQSLPSSLESLSSL